MPRPRGILRRKIRARDKWTCQLCRRVTCPHGYMCGLKSRYWSEEFKLWKKDVCKMGYRCLLVVHHIVPVREGKNNKAENAILLCKPCNRKVHKEIDKHVEAKDAPITKTLMNIVKTNTSGEVKS